MTPCLYILMRTDLPSMNPGKAMAQASHSSNAFVKDTDGDLDEKRAALTTQWKQETKQGFGTVLVLAATEGQIRDIVSKARGEMLAANIIIDPTYPYRLPGELAKLIPVSIDTVPRDAVIDPNATVTLFREEMTCGYIFGDKEGTAGQLVSELRLHP